jgi:sporulation protein YlmC with PRC-barrel domain
LSESDRYAKGSGRPRVLSASTLKGDKVLNERNENLGEIKEIMLDIETGEVAYMVLDHGSVAGMGGKLFAVPWNALKLDTVHHQFILNIDKDTLDRAEGFDKDKWPGTGGDSDPNWREKAMLFRPAATGTTTMGRGGESKLVAGTIATYLTGAIYPATKGQLLDQARSQGATGDVISRIDSLPDRVYRDWTDLEQELRTRMT